MSNPTQETDSPLAHSVDGACKRLGVSRAYLYELIRTGELRVAKFGRRTLVPETELQKVLAARLGVAA